ncbi:CPBP family intramembrane glutamic endopeptidase [Pedobacter sp. Du54]|uniref:CPBP family intramembrane glutamic endopeptidase n=1 Tax=Pedobacter anseongensis TaxID=3133439 RepID=UPI0030A66CEE
MQSTQTRKQENGPYVQLLLLGAFAIGGLLVAMLIGFGVAFVFYGPVLIKDTSWLSGNNPQFVGALKILLTAQQIGLFLIPALLLGITEGKKPQNFYGLKKPSLNILFIVFLIMACSTPLMGWINDTNQKMVLPEFLKGVEEWMRRMEDEGAKTTATLLKMKSIGDFLTTLIIVAIVPAICEEFLFRGALQRTFLRWIKNPHVAIWISAIIFSTIHFQFYGFFPRLFLGAAFGYIYFWTGSLWYTIFAHFLNNGFAVTISWYFQQKHTPLKGDEEIPVQWYGYIISAILTLALFKLLKDKTTKQVY